MFSAIIHPKLSDTDYFGNVTDAALARWFESARAPFFRIFLPDINFKQEDLPLFIADTDYDFAEQIAAQHEVEIRAWISHLGNKSFTVYHQAWQKGRLCAKGSAVAVHYDFSAKQSIPFPADKRKRLKEHLADAQKSLRATKAKEKQRKSRETEPY